MRSPARLGFTLIELVVVIAAATILTIIAAPPLRDFIVGQRVKTAAFSLVSSATLARSEAVKRNADVQLVPVTDSNWAGGWAVQVVSGAITLGSQEALTGVSMTASGTNVSAIRYASNGRLTASVSPLLVQGGSGSNQRCVTFDASGMPSSQLGVCP